MRFLLYSLLFVSFAYSLSTAAKSGQPDETAGRPKFLDSSAVENFVLFGKVWGYLKYHHPKVIGGCFDWDQELVSELPRLLKAQSEQQGRLMIERWVLSIEAKANCDNSGAIDQQLPPPTKWINDQQLPPPTKWVNDHQLLGPGLSKLLVSLGDPQKSTGQHYVALQPGVGNPLFNNEATYTDIEFIDWRYRTLALFRFWNIVEYWFPYRDLTDADWGEVIEDFVPKFYESDSREVYEKELLRLVATINDGHGNLWNSSGIRPPVGSAKPPFAIRVAEGEPYIWRRLSSEGTASPESDNPNKSGLKVGDVVLAVDGKPVPQLFAELWPYYGASNNVSKRRQIAQTFLVGDEEMVSVTVNRGGEVLEIVTPRVPKKSLNGRLEYWHDRKGETFQMLGDDIAYLKLSSIDAVKVVEYIKLASNAKGLIIDIRSYPAEFVVFALGQHLVSEATPFARFTVGSLTEPGSFAWTMPISIEPAEPFYDGKVVVITDDSSMSQAEYTAMAFRVAPNAIVVGSQTAGADGNLSQIPLPGGYYAGMSGIGVFYPDKSPTQRVGIVPDVEAHPTIDGLRAGRDEVLEVAIRQILGEDIPEHDIRDLAAVPK